MSAAQAGERKRALNRRPRTKQRQAGTFQDEREIEALPVQRPRRGKLCFRRSVFANAGVSEWARCGRNVVRLSVRRRRFGVATDSRRGFAAVVKRAG